MTINSVFCAELTFNLDENYTNLPIEEEINKPIDFLNDNNYQLNGSIKYNELEVTTLEDICPEKIQLNLTSSKYSKKDSFINSDSFLKEVEKCRKFRNPKVDAFLISPINEGEKYSFGKNIDYGTTFSAGIDLAQVEYRGKVYVKYKTKHLDFMTGIGHDSYTSSGKEMESLYFAPELKLGKSFAISDTFKFNPTHNKYKNEITFQYNPKFKHVKDRVKLEASLGHINYYYNDRQIYQFELSTQFRF